MHVVANFWFTVLFSRVSRSLAEKVGSLVRQRGIVIFGSLFGSLTVLFSRVRRSLAEKVGRAIVEA